MSIYGNPVGGQNSVKQAENADTLDGMHANEFAIASDVETLQTLVGDVAVSTQITNAISEINDVPSCTISDNGKFLRVVDGVATWETVQNIEEVAF